MNSLLLAEQVITICAANNKLFMGIPTKDVKKFQMDMLDYVRDHNGEIIHELEDKKVLTDELVEEIIRTVKEMKSAQM